MLLLAFWQVATTQRWTLLIPTPYAVAEYMVDFAVGGIYDDAYSATLLTHLLASMSRVYGGFALAALFALPIGIMVGRMPTRACCSIPSCRSCGRSRSPPGCRCR